MADGADRPQQSSGWAQPVIVLPAYPWLDQSEAYDTAVYDSGWHLLIRDMLRELDGVLTGTGVRFELRQIKEKLGYLRCYYRLPGASDELRNAVAAAYERAVERSGQTCIECGAPASMSRHDGRIGPLCPRHADPRS